MQIQILVKLHFAFLFFLILLLNSFKSNTVNINFFITFLQMVKVANYYWFASEPTIYKIILLANNH